MLEIANQLKQDYAVILMSEIQLNMQNSKDDNIPIAQPQIPDIRIWAGVINAADHFLGCDSVGQHIAKALDTQSTVVIGSTYPVNTSYINDPNVEIFDIGEDMRVYSPIRITNEEEPDRINDKCMDLNKTQTKQIVDSIRKKLGRKNTKPLLQVGGNK
jgi:ADP-heptose:LPS heptosyltransferase